MARLSVDPHGDVADGRGELSALHKEERHRLAIEHVDLALDERTAHALARLGDGAVARLVPARLEGGDGATRAQPKPARSLVPRLDANVLLVDSEVGHGAGLGRRRDGGGGRKPVLLDAGPAGKRGDAVVPLRHDGVDGGKPPVRAREPADAESTGKLAFGKCGHLFPKARKAALCEVDAYDGRARAVLVAVDDHALDAL